MYIIMKKLTINCIEIYLTTELIIRDKKFRIALVKLRTSAHDLEVEKGRHRNIDRNLRYCKNCSMQILENEFVITLAPQYRPVYIKLGQNFNCDDF